MNKKIDLMYENLNNDPNYDDYNTDNDNPDNSQQVVQETEDINKRIDSEITILVLRQKEIQFYITGLNSSNKSLNDEIAIESKKPQPNFKAINYCKLAIKENLELISTFYKIYQQLEETKSKYYNQLSTNRINKHKLLLEIRLKLKSGLGEQDPFTILANYIKNNQVSFNEQQNNNLIETNFYNELNNDNNDSLDDDDKPDSRFNSFTAEDYKL